MEPCPVERAVEAGVRKNAISLAVDLWFEARLLVGDCCFARLLADAGHRPGDGFWSAITAITVAQTEYRAMTSTARDQFIGAAVGGVVALACYFGIGQSLWSYTLAVILSVLGSSLINVQSARRLAAVTTTIILLVPHTGSVKEMMVSRLSEVGWGIAVAAGVVWAATRLGLIDRPED